MDDVLHVETEGIWRESVNLHQNAPYVLIWDEMQITGWGAKPVTRRPRQEEETVAAVQ